MLSATESDCGCAVFGGDVPESAKAMSHLPAMADVEVLDVASGSVTSLGAKLERRVNVVAFLRSFG